MAIEINGVVFQGMPGLDKDKLLALDYAGRVTWLRHRFDSFFMAPFRRLVSLDAEGGIYVWLCAVNLLCTAVEALSSFEFDSQSGMEDFARFVEEHFPTFRNTALRLDEPKVNRTPATKPSEHLYRYFRSGLAHGFCIEWGGLLHREDGAPNYLSVRKPIGNLQSLVIAPRDLIGEFENAIDDFFRKSAGWPVGSAQYDCFNARFESVFMICSAASAIP
jgi:hypothetical protein